MKMIALILMVFQLSLFVSNAEARIRLRKVKDAPKVCKLMSEDKLLSRDDKKVFSTERHSLIFEEAVELVKDKGEKICQWRLSELNTLAPLENFKFFIDEYKGMLYPYAKNADGSYLVIRVPLATCSLDEILTQASFEQPKCDKPKTVKRKKKKKKKA
jgi:hypothetical protein